MTAQETVQSPDLTMRPPLDRTEHLTRQELELDVLATIGELLARQSGQRRMVSAVLDQLERRLGMVRATVMLVSPDGAELVVEATRGGHESDRHAARYRRGEGVIGNEEVANCR
ncbi:MAG: hypothetical protein ACYC3X_22440 [Pirellulaceae bacterium]